MTQDYLKERLTYDPLTGLFTWRAHDSQRVQWNAKHAGFVAGHRQTGKAGRRKVVRIGLDGKLYLASRLAWLYMLGRWPEKHIDHINHVPTDDRWINLREVSVAENNRNQSKHRANTSGVTGVSRFKGTDKWRAYIRAADKQVHGGLFSSFEDAVAKRKELELKYGFHPNHGT